MQGYAAILAAAEQAEAMVTRLSPRALRVLAVLVNDLNVDPLDPRPAEVDAMIKVAVGVCELRGML